jgi:hypothetical protein
MMPSLGWFTNSDISFQGPDYDFTLNYLNVDFNHFAKYPPDSDWQISSSVHLQ